jgi:hypothetical protein
MMFGDVFDAFERASVRYVVVGGIAVVIHGHVRATADLDIIMDLGRTEARKGVDALSALGFSPTVPVRAADLADPETRSSWQRDKNMRVLSFSDLGHRVIDVFIEQPIPFDELWKRSTRRTILDTTLRLVSLEDLYRLKQMAGRPQDLSDIQELTEIERLRNAPRELSDSPFDGAGWDAQRRAYRESCLQSSPAERVSRLEELIAFATAAGATKR